MGKTKYRGERKCGGNGGKREGEKTVEEKQQNPRSERRLRRWEKIGSGREPAQGTHIVSQRNCHVGSLHSAVKGAKVTFAATGHGKVFCND